MSIQQNIDYHAQSLADKALSARDPQLIQSILGSLTNSIQNGTVKPYVGIPLVQSINQHLQTVSQQADMINALRQTPQVASDQTIGAQTLANAEPSPGIDTAPSNLPTQMAGGGIVAFDDGGEVESYANKGYVVPTDDNWLDEYRKTRQLGEANLVANRYGQPTQSVTAAGISTPYDAAIEYYKNYVPTDTTGKRPTILPGGMILGEGQKPEEIQKGIASLESRRNAWLAGSRDPFTNLPPVGSKYNISGIADTTPKKEDGIVIHDDKTAAKDTTPTVDVTATKMDALDELISKKDKDREDLKAMILGDEGERAKDKKIDLLLQAVKAGFKAASGTSPYAVSNIAPAGEEFATGVAGILSKEREEKTKRVGQLVALGLKGQELDTELAKLGITRDYYDAHKDLFKAQARYYDRRTSGSGTAGLGSVSSATVQSELDRIEGFKANPVSAPFFKNLPLYAQVALKETKPEKESYQRAMDLFNKEANRYAQNRLGIMQLYGAKQTPYLSGIPQD